MDRADSSYKKLADELRSQLERGAFANGIRLPTEAELAERHQVSRQTVRRAFQDLVAERRVYRVPGKGTFAASESEAYRRQFGSVEELMALSLDTRMQVVEPLCRRVDVSVADRLRLSSDSVYYVSFLRVHEGIRFCLTTVYLAPEVGSHLASVKELATPGFESDITVIGLVDAKLSSPITTAQQSITVALATEEASALLGVDKGAPLLRIDRLFFDADGHPVELAISHFVPQHYSYRTTLGRSVR
jgi:GntR family transcriptional regulator